MAGVAPAVELKPSTGSTNDDVMELARAGAAHGTCVATGMQTAGRGRRGHVWQSPEGGLYLSVLLRPGVPMSQFVAVPAVCSMGVVDALRACGCQDVGIKWPNDVVAGGRKLAGLLAEGGYGEGGAFVVVGIGINLVRQAAVEELVATAQDGSKRPLGPAFAQELLEDGTELPPLAELAERVRDAVLARVNAWTADIAAGRGAAGPLAPVLSEYFDQVPMLGKRVSVLLPDGREALQGTFAGVDVWGRATVVTDDGQQIELTSEQASLREL